MPVRHTPSIRTFRLISIADESAFESDMSEIDDDDIVYDPEIVEKILRAAEGPLREVTLEELYRELGILDDEK